MIREKSKANFLEDFQKTVYPTIQDRMLMHKAICEKLGDNLTSEGYIELCKEYFIELPIMPPAYGWEP